MAQVGNSPLLRQPGPGVNPNLFRCDPGYDEAIRDRSVIVFAGRSKVVAGVAVVIHVDISRIAFTEHWCPGLCHQRYSAANREDPLCDPLLLGVFAQAAMRQGV